MIFEAISNQIIFFGSLLINLIVFTYLIYLILNKRMYIRIIDIIRRPFRERSRFILTMLVILQSLSFFLIFIIPSFLFFSYQIDSYPIGTSWDISNFGEDSIFYVLQMYSIYGILLVLAFLAIGVYIIWPVISAVIAKDRFYYYKTMRYGIYSSFIILVILVMIFMSPFSSIPDSEKVIVDVGSTEWEKMKIPIVLYGVSTIIFMGYFFAIFIALITYFIFLKRIVIHLPIFFTGKSINDSYQYWFEGEQPNFDEHEMYTIFKEEFLAFSPSLNNLIDQHVTDKIDKDKTETSVLEYTICLASKTRGFLFNHERIPVIIFKVRKTENNKYFCGIIGFWENYNNCSVDNHLLRRFTGFSEILKQKGFIRTESSPYKDIWEKEQTEFYSKGYSPFITRLNQAIRRKQNSLDGKSSPKLIIQQNIPEKDLLEMLEQKYLEEDEFIEFKDKLPKSMNDISKKICALTNTNSGAIFIGVDDNGKIIGCNVENTMQRIAGVCKNVLQPRVNLTYYILRKSSKIRVVLAIVPCSKQVIRANNIAYTMEGRTVIQLTFEEEKNLELEKRKKKSQHEIIEYLIEKHKYSKLTKLSGQ